MAEIRLKVSLEGYRTDRTAWFNHSDLISALETCVCNQTILVTLGEDINLPGKTSIAKEAFYIV